MSSGARLRQGHRVAASSAAKSSHAMPFDSPAGRRRPAMLGQFARVEQHLRLGARHLDGDLVDIAVLAAKAGRQRQRHRPGTRHRPHRKNSARSRGRSRRSARSGRPFDTPWRSAGRRASASPRAARKGHRPGQIAARIVEIEAALSARGIVQRLAESGEIGETARQRVAAGQAKRSPDPQGLAARFAELGYIDDASYARMKGSSMQRRGLGVARIKRRVGSGRH
jgi:hypothetical protein